jgi:serine/threonine protein kinase
MGVGLGSRVGSYEIVGAIGAGGMGEVWRARDTNLRRDVAIKKSRNRSPARSNRRTTTGSSTAT